MSSMSASSTSRSRPTITPNRRLIRHRLAAEVDASKTPHRLRIIKRLFDRRVRQIEPVLQEIDAQHPLDPDWWAAIARLRIERFDQRAQRRPRHNPLHLGQKHCPPRRLGVALKPRHRQCQLLHSPKPMRTNPPHQKLYHNHCSWLLQSFPRIYRARPYALLRQSLFWRTLMKPETAGMSSARLARLDE